MAAPLALDGPGHRQKCRRRWIGGHRSALSDEAITHFGAEVAEKVKSGQAKLVAWESIKDNPPIELKISPIAAIPHKSKQLGWRNTTFDWGDLCCSKYVR